MWIVDWAWPTRGAAFIDAACFLIRAMAAGHSADQAEALAARCPGWQAAPSAAIDVFALASARLYDEIARTTLSRSSAGWPPLHMNGHVTALARAACSVKRHRRPVRLHGDRESVVLALGIRLGNWLVMGMARA